MGYACTHLMVLLFVCHYCLAEDYNPPIITYPNGSLNFYYESGSNVRIICTANGNPTPTYRWLENGLEIRPTREVQYNRTSGLLEINSFSLRQQTAYMCMASNLYEGETNQSVIVATMSPKIRLWQLRMDKFTSVNDVIKNVAEYDYLMLPCDNTKTVVAPPLRFLWYNTGDSSSIGLAAGRLYIDVEGNLHFTYLLLGDSRIPGYACGISTKLSDGSTSAIRIGTKYIVKVTPAKAPPDTSKMKPTFQFSNNVVYAMKDSAATMECVFGGYGKRLYPIISWVDINGTEPFLNSSKYSISIDGRQMTVNNVQENDEQFYICSASYGPGLQSSFAVFLNVTSPPVFIKSPPISQVGIENSTADFICDAKSLKGEMPPSPPDWFINGERMINTYDRDKFQLSDDRKVLTVKKLRRHLDVMCIQCEVDNHVGSVIASGFLKVISEIQILTQPKEVQVIEYGGVIDLTVTARTDPPLDLSYRWYFPNGTYDEDNIPEYMSYDRQSHVAVINTSKLSFDEYKLQAGMYKINVFHQHESRIVETQVILMEIPTTTTTTTTVTTVQTIVTGNVAPRPPDSYVPWWLTFLLLVCVAAVVIIIFILLLTTRKKEKHAVEEEKAYTVVDIGMPQRSESRASSWTSV